MTKPKTIHTDKNRLLCEWLCTQRTEQKVSIRKLAARLDWPSAIVGKVFVGDRRLDVVEYVSICDALGVNACEGLNVINTKVE